MGRTTGKRRGAARKVRESKKATAAVELREQGLTLEEIAKRIGYFDASGARKAIHGLLEKHEAASVAELRAHNSIRLEALLHAHLPIAMNPKDKGAVDSSQIVMHAVRELAKLHGLYPSTKTELTGAGGGPIQTLDWSKLSNEQMERIVAGESLDAVLGAAGESSPGAAAPAAGTRRVTGVLPG